MAFVVVTLTKTNDKAAGSAEYDRLHVGAG